MVKAWSTAVLATCSATLFMNVNSYTFRVKIAFRQNAMGFTRGASDAPVKRHVAPRKPRASLGARCSALCKIRRNLRYRALIPRS